MVERPSPLENYFQSSGALKFFLKLYSFITATDLLQSKQIGLVPRYTNQDFSVHSSVNYLICQLFVSLTWRETSHSVLKRAETKVSRIVAVNNSHRS